MVGNTELIMIMVYCICLIVVILLGVIAAISNLFK